jgi:hypothetical protein
MAAVGSPFENACILTGVGVIAIMINSAVVTRWGRRRLFLVTGMVICGFAQLIVAIVYDKKGPGKSTGKVGPNSYTSLWNVSNIKTRSSSVSPLYTSSATTAWSHLTPGFVVASSRLNVSEVTRSDWPLLSASSAPGSRLLPRRTLSILIP